MQVHLPSCADSWAVRAWFCWPVCWQLHRGSLLYKAMGTGCVGHGVCKLVVGPVVRFCVVQKKQSNIQDRMGLLQVRETVIQQSCYGLHSLFDQHCLGSVVKFDACTMWLWSAANHRSGQAMMWF